MDPFSSQAFGALGSSFSLLPTDLKAEDPLSSEPGPTGFCEELCLNSHTPDDVRLYSPVSGAGSPHSKTLPGPSTLLFPGRSLATSFYFWPPPSHDCFSELLLIDSLRDDLADSMFTITQHAFIWILN